MNMWNNTIFAAVLCAGLIAMLSGFFAGKLVKPEKLSENAVPVEVAESSVGAGAGAAKPKAEPILSLIATADIERGKTISKACAACHSFDKGGPNGVGPNLWDIVNNKKHHIDGFAYSGALLANGEPNWTYLSLNKFMWKPKEYAPGTKMNYIGLKKPGDRAALIAWLRTLADSPVALPSEADIAAELAELAPPAVETVPGEDSQDPAAAASAEATPAEDSLAVPQAASQAAQ